MPEAFDSFLKGEKEVKVTMSAQHTELAAGDRGPNVNIVAWVSLIGACLATFNKVITKYWRTHGLQMDDVYMLCAMVGLVYLSFGGSVPYLGQES